MKKNNNNPEEDSCEIKLRVGKDYGLEVDCEPSSMEEPHDDTWVEEDTKEYYKNLRMTSYEYLTHSIDSSLISVFSDLSRISEILKIENEPNQEAKAYIEKLQEDVNNIMGRVRYLKKNLLT